MLAVWDCIYAFRDVLELADIAVDQFSRALIHPKHSPMLTEIHMCLLEKILEDRCEAVAVRMFGDVYVF